MISPEPDNQLLLNELESACECGRAIASKGELPLAEVRALERIDGKLRPTMKAEVDWRLFLPMFTRTPDFWERMRGLAEQLAEDTAIKELVGWDSDTGVQGQTLWKDLLSPTLQRYGRRVPDWGWNEGLAWQLLNEWWEGQRSPVIWHRTIAPLHNFRGPAEELAVENDLRIRPFTDEDRSAIWRGFGGSDGFSSLSPTVGDLAQWTHAIDYRWQLDRQPPLSGEQAVEQIADLVRSIRLIHPGVTGTTILWTQADPPDAPAGPHLPNSLQEPHGAGLYIHPLTTQIGPHEGPLLAELLGKLQDARQDRVTALALRRFDSAYTRYEYEDSIVDLWVAFEALLLPDIRTELSFRAALRIAHLVGRNAKERRQAFVIAKRSYKARSGLVHGAPAPKDLSEIAEETRELARRVVRIWLQNRPSGGVEELDQRTLA